ncbi:uncharacterized protein LOC114543636 [Dendronephthya gigantea]|uniref:uncharacterized protein LOC114543636 n=1 Tax=Dendronephthya gigantea TaxID=151771 RepID=UPI00106BCC54|nr:uncharacterized protein LOC114543636 [Dendronephthya gigantea]
MIIDTGSNITIVRPDILRKISKEKTVEIKPVESCLRTVIGDTTAVRGRGCIHIQIGDLKTAQEVWIAEIENECILGLDFLGPNGCIVNVADRCLRVGIQEIQLQPLVNKEQPRCRRVWTAETTTIPARSEALISGQLQDGEYGESVRDIWGSLEPAKNRGLPSEVILARTVVDVRKPTFVVRVMNLSDEERVIRKGTEVASCESVECVTLSGESEVSERQQVPEFHQTLRELYERSAEGLDGSQRKKLYALLAYFEDIFSKGSHDIGRTSLTSHKIDTGDSS